MIRNPKAVPQATTTATPVPRVPAWALPRGPVETDAEAAYLAGGALNSLDVLVLADPPWLGAWRHRLALKAAAATLKLLRRPEDEAALRDAWPRIASVLLCLGEWNVRTADRHRREASLAQRAPVPA